MTCGKGAGAPGAVARGALKEPHRGALTGRQGAAKAALRGVDAQGGGAQGAGAMPSVALYRRVPTVLFWYLTSQARESDPGCLAW